MSNFISFILFMSLAISNLTWALITNISSDMKIVKVSVITKFVRENPTQHALDVVQCINVRVLNQNRSIKTVIDHKWLNRCIGR